MTQTPQDDGQAVGAGDYAADRHAHGADDDSGDRGLNASDPFDLVAGADAPGSDDGEAVGAADRDADAERSR